MIDTTIAHPTTTETEERFAARLRIHHILKEAEERYRNELLGEEERCELHSRIIRLKTKLAASAS